MSWKALGVRAAPIALLFQFGAASAAPPWEACFEAAGRHFRIAPELLVAIAEQESSLDPDAVHRNRDGSRDVGLMQINERWLPTLSRWGISPSHLLDPCVSIWTGAWVLARNFAVRGYSWEAVGEYNAGAGAGRAALRAAYAHRISRRLRRGDGRHDAHGVRSLEATAVFGIAGSTGVAGDEHRAKRRRDD